MKKIILTIFISTCCFVKGYANYEDGVNAYIVKDYEKAFIEFTSAAEKGDPKSQYELGKMHYRGIGDLPYGYEIALNWFLKSAKQRNREAEYQIGYMYYYGQGVLKDYKKAVKWIKKSAGQNYSEAQLKLGFLYIYGDGVNKDMAKAKFWTEKAYSNPESSDKTKRRAKNQWDTFELWDY